MGTTTAESLIIDFDEVDGGHGAADGQRRSARAPAAPAPPPAPPAPPAAAPTQPNRPTTQPGIVVTDDGPPAVLPVRPAMVPTHNRSPSSPPAPEPDAARWVLRRDPPGNTPAPSTSRPNNPIKGK